MADWSLPSPPLRAIGYHSCFQTVWFRGTRAIVERSQWTDVEREWEEVALYLFATSLTCLHHLFFLTQHLAPLAQPLVWRPASSSAHWGMRCKYDLTHFLVARVSTLTLSTTHNTSQSASVSHYLALIYSFMLWFNNNIQQAADRSFLFLSQLSVALADWSCHARTGWKGITWEFFSGWVWKTKDL